MLNVSVLMITPGGQPDPRLEAAAQALESKFAEKEYLLRDKQWVSDEAAQIKKAIRVACDNQGHDVVITLGGIGLQRRDRVPEATRELIEHEVPGLAELIRITGLQKSRLVALSRGVSGLRGKSLILNFGGSEVAALEAFNAVVSLFPFIFEDKPNNWV